MRRQNMLPENAQHRGKDQYMAGHQQYAYTSPMVSVF